MLFMRIADADLTARARLRDAAIECFAAVGFDASVRTIADRAGVSAGLIRHHFGSKEALREECDQAILERYHDLKATGIDSPPTGIFGQFLADEETGVLLVYILRSVRDGGEPGRRFLEQLVEDAARTADTAVSRGLVVPSRDQGARVRYLVYQSIGAMIVHLSMRPDLELSDFSNVLREVVMETTLPTLELFTEGLFTTRSYLDDYLAYLQSASPEPATDRGPEGESSQRS